MFILSIDFIWILILALVIAFLIYKRKANKFTFTFIYVSIAYILFVLFHTLNLYIFLKLLEDIY